MLKKLLLSTSVLLFLSGCVQVVNHTPTVLEPTQTKKIGYLINVRPNPTHTHIGTTALTNFTKNYPFNWQIPMYIKSRLELELGSHHNVQLINLAQHQIKPSSVNGLLKQINTQWVVAKGKENTYQNLTKALGLSTIIIINESPKQAINDCNILGCKEFSAKGYGLFTRSFINRNTFISATALYVHIYQLNPVRSLDPKVAEINHSKKMTTVAVSKGSKVESNKIGFIYPKNFNNWTEQEFKPFRLPLIKYIDGLARKVANVVKTN